MRRGRLASIMLLVAVAASGVGFRIGSGSGILGCSSYAFPDGTTNPNSAFPCPNNTGVPVGATLTTWTGGTELGCGTVIDHKVVDSNLDIVATNNDTTIWNDETQARAHACVIITNSIVHGVVYSTFSSSKFGPTYIADSEIAGKPVCVGATNGSTTCDIASIGQTNFHMWRDYVHGMRAGIQCDGYCEVHDSYVVADTEDGSAHMDAYITNGTAQRATAFDHNTWLCWPTYGDPVPQGAGCNTGFLLSPDFSTTGNVTVTGNLMLASNAFRCTRMLAADLSGAAPNPNTVVENNVYSDRCQPSVVARLGANDADSWGNATMLASSGSLWCNNTFASGGPVTSDAAGNPAIPDSAGCP